MLEIVHETFGAADAELAVRCETPRIDVALDGEHDVVVVARCDLLDLVLGGPLHRKWLRGVLDRFAGDGMLEVLQECHSLRASRCGGIDQAIVVLRLTTIDHLGSIRIEGVWLLLKRHDA